MKTGEYGKVPIDPERPWPGLLSFPEAAAHLFHGRRREVDELLRLLAGESVCFVYGKSGLGKTSLLQAGLFPRLRETDRVPVYIRLSHESGSQTPTQQIFGAITEALDAAGVDGPRPASGDTLWGYLHRRDVEWWSARNHPVRLVLVIDQFEELFTLGLSRTSTRDRFEEVVETLEELTTARPGAGQRAAFDTQPDRVETFDYEALRYAVLFAFREDFLPAFDQLRERLRINPHNRLALEHLTGDGAVESVLGTGGRLVDASVAQAIVRFVSGDSRTAPAPLASLEVEPWLLSLVCEQLNERRLLQQPAPARISDDLLTGSRDEILAQYYARCISAFDPRVSAFLEDRLLTEGGYRNPYPYDEAVRLDGITPSIVDQLVDARLVRREQHMGAQRLEVTHDVLGPVMLRYREQRVGRERDAIAHLRTMAERRRAFEGRRRSGVMVVLATVIVTVLSAVVWLRQREADNARRLAAWGRETQGYAYEGMLQLVRQRPISNSVRASVRGLLSSTRSMRQSFPRDVSLLAHEVQFTYLQARAMAAPALSRGAVDTIITLADSLARMPGIELQPDVAEFAYRLASITAREGGQAGRANIFLRRRADLIDGPPPSDFNLAYAAAAATELSYYQRDPVAREDLLSRAVRGLNRVDDLGSLRLNLDSLTTAAGRLATEVRQRPGASRGMVRRLHALAAQAHQLRVETAFALAERDSTSREARSRLVSALGNHGYWLLLAGDFEQSARVSRRAMQLDRTATWIEQNLHHALLFLGKVNDVWPRARTLYYQPLSNGVGTYRQAALDDIKAFREAGLSHPDLDRYEAFFIGRQ